jgi:hypothetical protein
VGSYPRSRRRTGSGPGPLRDVRVPRNECILYPCEGNVYAPGHKVAKELPRTHLPRTLVNRHRTGAFGECTVPPSALMMSSLHASERGDGHDERGYLRQAGREPNDPGDGRHNADSDRRTNWRLDRSPRGDQSPGVRSTPPCSLQLRRVVLRPGGRVPLPSRRATSQRVGWDVCLHPSGYGPRCQGHRK